MSPPGRPAAIVKTKLLALGIELEAPQLAPSGTSRGTDDQVARILGPSPCRARSEAAWRHLKLPTHSDRYSGHQQQQQTRQRLLGRVRDGVGASAPVAARIPGTGLDGLVLAMRSTGPMIWNTPVEPDSTRLSSVKLSSPFSSMKSCREGIEGHPEAITQAVGEDLLEVGPTLAFHIMADVDEGIVLRGGAVVVEPQDHPVRWASSGSRPPN